MDIKIYKQDDRMLVQLSGRVVLDECDRLKSTVVPQISAEISHVNLDLSKVDFIDSAGLGVLVAMKVSSNKSRASLVLISPSKGVNDILLVSKLDSIFDIKTASEAEEVRKELDKPENLVSEKAMAAAGAAAGGSSYQSPPAQRPSGSDQTQGGTPKEQIDRLCKAAVDFMRQRDYDSAADCYLKTLKIDKDYMPALNNLGIVYEKKPEWHDKAVEQWNRVMELSEQRGDQKHVERAQKHLSKLQTG